MVSNEKKAALRGSKGFLLSVALLTISGSATATPIVTVHLDAHDPQLAVFGRSVIDPLNGQRVTASNMQGGRFRYSVTGGDFTGAFAPAGAFLNSFYAFCIEPREFVSLGGNYVYFVDPLAAGTTNIGGMGAQKANKLRELFGRWYPDFSQPLTRMQAGALQIAVWEIVREDSGTLDVYGGDIYFFTPSDTPVGTVALGQTYVQSVNGLGPRATGLVALTRTGLVQDVIAQVHTPEPAVALSVGCGLLALGVLLKRRSGAHRLRQ